jgi:NADH-quinone oxidoreductase subunit E
MLSPEETHEIEAELALYPERRAVAIEALKIVQRHRGWVSDEALADVAALLAMTTHELDAVATFYSLVFRRPVGQHVLLLCDSVSCWIMGCDRLAAGLRARLGVGLGETSADGRFTVLPAACLGVCEGAPALMVGEDLHQRATPEGLDAILARYPEGSR